MGSSALWVDIDQLCQTHKKKRNVEERHSVFDAQSAAAFFAFSLSTINSRCDRAEFPFSGFNIDERRKKLLT